LWPHSSWALSTPFSEWGAITYEKAGGQTWKFESRPRIVGSATVVGPDEGKGPLSTDFDYIYDNLEINEKTWEKAERRLFEHSTELALINANLNKEEVQFFISGDLMNQIISSSFSARKLAIPYLGVFGACSTSMESLALAALIVDSEAGDYVMAGTTSHNCTVEKQFRYPTEYGSQKPPTAQYTVTGSGTVVVGHAKTGTVVDCATIGRVMDMGIKDPFNMGGAMASAAADTLLSHFRDTGRDPGYYDLIVGALLSPLSTQQGESIPCIAHAVALEGGS
jgi:stage V sporulation protein AD